MWNIGLLPYRHNLTYHTLFSDRASRTVQDLNVSIHPKIPCHETLAPSRRTPQQVTILSANREPIRIKPLCKAAATEVAHALRALDGARFGRAAWIAEAENSRCRALATTAAAAAYLAGAQERLFLARERTKNSDKLCRYNQCNIFLSA